MPLQKWIELGASLDIKKREYVHKIPKNTYGTHEAKVIKFKTHGFRRGSFRYLPKDDFSNMQKLIGTYSDIEKRAKNTKHTNDESFLLLANSYDHPAWDAPNRKEIREGILSVMTVHIWGMSMIDFVTLATTEDLIDLEKDFKARVKKAWVKII